jgi:hypothetical protein
LPAPGAKVAAVAYVIALPHLGVHLDSLARVWVKDMGKTEGMVQLPLVGDTPNSIKAWVAQDTERAKWIQAACQRMRQIMRAN